jgi:hypothetical protein
MAYISVDMQRVNLTWKPRDPCKVTRQKDFAIAQILTLYYLYFYQMILSTTYTFGVNIWKDR